MPGPPTVDCTAVSIARSLERRLEQFVDGMSARIFRGAMHPVELANRIVREADLAETSGLTGPTIPNAYRITVGTDEAPSTADLNALERELRGSLEATAADRGWRLNGPATVTVIPDPNATGISVVAVDEPGEPAPWGRLESSDGRTVLLRYNRTMVGRSSDVDARLDHPQVSRYHALIWREAGAVWLVDLESSNGTIVAGAPAAADPVELRPDDIVIFGPLAYRFTA